MPKLRELTDEKLLALVPRRWATTGDIHVQAGLAGHQIGLDYTSLLLRKLVDKGLIEHNGQSGTRNLRWRRIDV